MRVPSIQMMPRPDSEGVMRALSVATVTANGYAWPPILDEEFPPQTEGGIEYDRVSIE